MGEAPQPRFRVRIASIDGGRVTSICSLGLTPECAIHDIKQTDIIILPASGLDVQDRIARNTSLLPWLRKWHARGAYIAGICTRRRLPGRMRAARRTAGDHALGGGRRVRQRYPKVLLAARAVRDRGRPDVLQRRRLRLDRSQPLSGGKVVRPRDRAAMREVAAASACRAAGSRATRCCRCPARIPTTRSGETEEYLQEHFASDLSIELWPIASA